MIAVGIVNLVVYKIIKRWIARPRPYRTCPGIRACARSLDEFSFPSGHTLHSVAFSVILTAYYPAFAIFVWPFTLLVAVSRVVLGLHYPSDVIVGGADRRGHRRDQLQPALALRGAASAASASRRASSSTRPSRRRPAARGA